MYLLSIIFAYIAQNPPNKDYPDNENQIPDYLINIIPHLDIYPGNSLSNAYEDHVPLSNPANTPVVENLASMTPDGDNL